MAELFVAHVDGVYNVAFRVVWNRADAEDVVQRTFLKAVRNIQSLREPSKARGWLLQIAYREAIAVVRSRREQPIDPSELPETRAALDDSPERHAVGTAVAEMVHRALAAMDEDERLAVVLRDVEGLPMREVAAVTGVGLSAAKMRVHRGRQDLRARLTRMEVL